MYLFCRDFPKGTDENILCLNYGKTTIGETPKAVVVLTNKTAIATKYSVTVNHFCAARIPTPPTGKIKMKIRPSKIMLQMHVG